MRLIGGGGGWGRKGEAMNPIPCTCRGDDIKYRSIVDRYNHHLPHCEALFGKGVRRMTRYIATLHSRNIFINIIPIHAKHSLCQIRSHALCLPLCMLPVRNTKFT